MESAKWSHYNLSKFLYAIIRTNRVQRSARLVLMIALRLGMLTIEI
jgi:hypothetical protein